MAARGVTIDVPFLQGDYMLVQPAAVRRQSRGFAIGLYRTRTAGYLVKRWVPLSSCQWRSMLWPILERKGTIMFPTLFL